MCNSVLPAPHLSGVQDEWRLGAGPSRRGSSCRCAQVGWEAVTPEPQSDGSSPKDLRAWGGQGRCQLKKTFLQNKPHRLPESCAKTRGRSGLEWNPRGAPPPTSRPGARSGPAPSRESGSGLCLEYSIALCSKQKYGSRLHAGLPPSNPIAETPETQKHLRITENNNGDWKKKKKVCEKEKYPTAPHQPTAASRGKAAPAQARVHWLLRRRLRASIGRAACQSGAGRRARRPGRGARCRSRKTGVCGVASVPAAATFNRQQRRCRAAAES